MGTSQDLTSDNKKRYQTLTQTVHRPRTMVHFVAELFLRYGWDSCILLRKGHLFLRVGDTMEEVLREANIRPYSIYPASSSEEEFTSALKEASLNGRSEYERNGYHNRSTTLYCSLLAPVILFSLCA